MLSDTQKTGIQQLLKNISASLPNYRSRLSQRRMIAAIAHALSRAQPRPQSDEETATPNQGESILAVEGPTGTGKSLAYLIAAAFMAHEAGRKLIISSATVNLQDQLVNRDIPFFLEHAGFQARSVLAKGRSRYVCQLRLMRVAGIAHANSGQTELFEAATWERRPEQDEIALLRRLHEEYALGRWNGDRDALSDPVPGDLWSRITTDRHGCLNRKCAHYDNCAQMKARAAIREADIVVANHDLLLADIALGGGVILPEPEQSFYVFDEAHHLPDKAVDAFSAAHPVERSITLIERAEPLMTRLKGALPDSGALLHVESAMEQGSQLVKSLDALKEGLTAQEKLIPSGIARQPMLRFQRNTPFGDSLCAIGHNIHLCAEQIGKHADTLLAALEALREQAGEQDGLNELIAELGSFAGRVSGITQTWSLVLMEEAPDEAPIARWVMTEVPRGSRDAEYYVCASPVSAAARLSALLWERVGGAILTSATLCSLGNFDKLLMDTGLDRFAQTQTLQLDSPFDFSRQGVIEVPRLRSSPKDPAAHTAEITELLPDLIHLDEGAGTLVLFSSRRQMEEVAAGLPDEMRAITQLQGERPRADIINAHMARIEAGQPAILFGLDSFAEGLDLPGNACTHVIIAKLPFAVPDHPVAVTLAEWIEARGGRPFMEVTVPAACLKLIQAVGRLIRTESDAGRVTILDTRIVQTRYGRQMLDSLPPFRRIIFGREEPHPDSVIESPN